MDKTVLVVGADKIAVIVKAANRIGEGIVILEFFMYKISIGRVAETLPAVVFIIVENAVF